MISIDRILDIAQRRGDDRDDAPRVRVRTSPDPNEADLQVIDWIAGRLLVTVTHPGDCGFDLDVSIYDITSPEDMGAFANLSSRIPSNAVAAFLEAL